MHTFGLLTVTVLSLSGSVWGQRLDKPVLSPEMGSGSMSKIYEDFKNEVAKPKSSFSTWDTTDGGWIPVDCKDHAKANNLNPVDFDIRNLKYDDCPGSSWVVCRHKNHPETWDSVTQSLGLVPVGMRSYLSNLLLVPRINHTAWGYGDNVHAYAAGTMIVSKAPFALSVAIHELTHAMDWIALADVVANNSYPAGTRYSRTAMWNGAFKKDTHIPTSYAQNNIVEDFAEVGMFGVAHILHKGGLAVYTSNFGKVANQFGNFRANLASLIYPPGGKCVQKIPSSTAVKKLDSAKFKVGKVPEYAQGGVGDNVKVLIPPPGDLVPPHGCGKEIVIF